MSHATSCSPAALPAGFARAVKAIVGHRVDEREAILQVFSEDATPLVRARPQMVVHPRSTEEVSAILRLANDAHVPVTTRGAGSNLCGATVPLTGGVVMVMTQMNKLLELNADEMIAVCEPGLPTGALVRAADRQQLLYPPDPGSVTVSTIGGNVATSAGGLRGMKYGTTRDYVLGLEAVRADGEVFRTGGRLAKDVAGYDLTRLLVGSEGTLAVITEVTVALVRKPDTALYGIAYFEDLETASDVVAKVLSSGPAPSTLEFLDATCIAAVEEYAQLGLDLAAGALLLFGDDGTAEAVEANVERMARICGASARSVELAQTVAGAEALLQARKCSLPALARAGRTTVLEDVSVPRPRLADMVRRIRETADHHGILMGTFGHAGDGNLHPTAVIDERDAGQVAATHAAFGEIFTTALKLGGTITGEHGVGIAKRDYMTARFDEGSLRAMRDLKSTFDPHGILNPGKLGS